jgi:hypothetical protein
MTEPKTAMEMARKFQERNWCSQRAWIFDRHGSRMVVTVGACEEGGLMPLFSGTGKGRRPPRVTATAWDGLAPKFLTDCVSLFRSGSNHVEVRLEILMWSVDEDRAGRPGPGKG